MRIYLGSTGPGAFKTARETAPSHVYGACWTPQKMTPHEWPYFIDNGAYTDSFDEGEWLALLNEVPERMPYLPDFVVLPDVYNDAEATLEHHRRYVPEVRDRNLLPAPVLQPGLPVRTQVALYDRLNVRTVFVGGECRWQSAHAEEIVETAHEHALNVHIGNPGSRDSMVRWARLGVDSMDTTSIVQNGNWDWLRAVEGLSRGARKKGGRQGTLTEVADAR